MAIAGRVAIVPKGDWSADATYKRLDAVTHNNTLYFAKKDVPAGTETSNTEYWSKSVVGSAVTVDDALSSTSTNPVQNKVVTSNLIDIRKEVTVNLLNPTMATSTANGVTCTNNGDGTYTLNGTANSNMWFTLTNNIKNNLSIGHYKYIEGGGKEVDDAKVSTYLALRSADDNQSIGLMRPNNIANISSECKYYQLFCHVPNGAIVNNVVVKPMLTTNLNATYDDFVPYTGDTGRLNGDVAELKAQNVKKDNVVNNQITTEEGFALDARQANPNIDGTLAKQISDLNGSLIKVVTKTVDVKVDPYGINNWYYMDFDLRNDIDLLKYTLISAYNSYSQAMVKAQVIAFSYIDGLVIRLIFSSELPNGKSSFNFIFALAN